jgi:hypothetical protein
MHKILVIRLYFPLDALHISDYISPSGATSISCTSHLVYAGTIRVAVVWLQPRIGMYQMRCTVYKVVPDDGLI